MRKIAAAIVGLVLMVFVTGCQVTVVQIVPNTPTVTPTRRPGEATPTATPTYQSLIPATSTPGPSPTPTATRTDTPEPTATPESTNTPESTATPEPTATTEPTATLEPTDTPEPSATPEPTDTPEPTATSEPTAMAAPTETPTSKPAATATTAPTRTPTKAPTATAKPVALAPRATATPRPLPTPTPRPRVQPTATRAGVAAAGAPAAAPFEQQLTQQECNTLIQEAVAKNPSVPVSDLGCDFQPGQAVITGRAKVGFFNINLAITVVVDVSNCKAMPRIKSVEPAMAQAQVEAAIAPYLGQIADVGADVCVQKVTITDNMLTIEGTQ